MTTLKPLLLAVATFAFAVAPLVTPPFTGYDPAMFPVPIVRPAIQPAGYAFSIWGLIYIWLVVHAGYGLWKRRDVPAWDAVRWPLIIAVGIGAVWLAIASSYPVTATITIWIMLGAALLAFLRADPVQDRWLLSAPTAIFAGWLSAAAAVSLGVLLAGYGWLSDTASAILMLALVLVVAMAVQRARPTMPVYGLTVIWALIGVVVANAYTNLTVAVLATIGAGIMAATLWLVRRS